MRVLLTVTALIGAVSRGCSSLPSPISATAPAWHVSGASRPILADNSVLSRFGLDHGQLDPVVAHRRSKRHRLEWGRPARLVIAGSDRGFLRNAVKPLADGKLQWSLCEILLHGHCGFGRNCRRAKCGGQSMPDCSPGCGGGRHACIWRRSRAAVTTAAVGRTAAAVAGGWTGVAVASATVVLLPFAAVAGAWRMAKSKKNKKEQAIQQAVAGCLTERGYPVVGWEPVSKKISRAVGETTRRD